MTRLSQGMAMRSVVRTLSTWDSIMGLDMLSCLYLLIQDLEGLCDETRMEMDKLRLLLLGTGC